MHDASSMVRIKKNLQEISIFKDKICRHIKGNHLPNSADANCRQKYWKTTGKEVLFGYGNKYVQVCFG